LKTLNVISGNGCWVGIPATVGRYRSRANDIEKLPDREDRARSRMEKKFSKVKLYRTNAK